MRRSDDVAVAVGPGGGRNDDGGFTALFANCGSKNGDTTWAGWFRDVVAEKVGLTGGGLIRRGGDGDPKIPRDKTFFLFFFCLFHFLVLSSCCSVY